MAVELSATTPGIRCWEWKLRFGYLVNKPWRRSRFSAILRRTTTTLRWYSAIQLG